jgi:hypothetical protein
MKFVISVYIPASVASLPKLCIRNWGGHSIVRFDAASKLLQIETFAFSHSELLRSICIPSPVLVLHDSYFSSCCGLRQIVFERGSQRRRIESGAFASYHSWHICIPSLVSSIDGSAFIWSPNVQITVEAGDSHFSVVDSFRLDVAGLRLIRDSGARDEVIDVVKIQIVSKYAFTSRVGLIQITDFRRRIGPSQNRRACIWQVLQYQSNSSSGID